MTLKTYVWGMRFITLLTFGALGAVVFYVDPDKSAPLGIVLFYVVFFFALSSVLNLFLLFIRRKTLGDELAVENIELNFRQGILLAILAVSLLIFRNFDMLVWWVALLVLAGIFLIELYFLSRK